MRHPDIMFEICATEYGPDFTVYNPTDRNAVAYYTLGHRSNPIAYSDTVHSGATLLNQGHPCWPLAVFCWSEHHPERYLFHKSREIACNFIQEMEL